VRGSHIKLGEGERKVRLGQDSLPNKAETSGDYICCFTRTQKVVTNFESLPIIQIIPLIYNNISNPGPSVINLFTSVMYEILC
jgi:hypothetical protein